LRVGVISGPGQETNPEIVRAWCAAGITARLLSPAEARWRLDPGDVALIRLDVRETLDGIEPGLRLLQPLARLGVRLLNRPGALIGAHDKLKTAHRLGAAGVAHPRWAHVTSPGSVVDLAPPFVVKPRFGSWGRDAFLCESERQLRRCLENVRFRPWFLEHGALVQELVSRTTHDLRLIVAGGQVVGAARRNAAPGEWRTNVSLGGSLAKADPDCAAVALAVRAVAAIGMDLAGVDLLPLPDGGHVVLELNGAVDFDDRYSLRGGDAYLDAAAALGLLPGAGSEHDFLGVHETAIDDDPISGRPPERAAPTARHRVIPYHESVEGRRAAIGSPPQPVCGLSRCATRAPARA
jgi:RimK family alpha-L-glutamate ligase